MAAFAVAFDGTRVVDASSTTGWTADTATPTAEPDFFYQGTGSISCTVKTSEIGMYYTSASQDLTTPKVAVLKVLATNKDVLDGNGLVLRIGSATTAYYQYNSVFTATTYPIAGGWQIVCIDPNVSQWRSSTTGSPSLSAVVYWAIRADFSATSKSQNVAMDAIDHVTNGTGLTGTAGDGASADGTFADFVTADEGTANNRWGIVKTLNGILYVSGVVTIGSSGAATEFTDSNQVLVFPHHRVTNGFCGIDFNIQNASTVISSKSCFFSGRGSLFTSDDTRPDYTTVGTSGTLDVSSSTFSVFRQIDWNSKVTAKTTVYVNGLKVVGDGVDLRGSTFSGCTGAADASYLGWNVATDPDGKLDSCSFTKGSTATHAIELGTTSPLNVTFRGITSTSYNASNGQNDSFFMVQRTAPDVVTINLVGCTGNFSYKTAGATVVVQSTVTVKVTVKNKAGAAIQGVRVLVYDTAVAPGDLGGIVREETNASGVAQESYNFVSPITARVIIRKKGYNPIRQDQPLGSGGLDITYTLEPDTIVE